MSLMATSTSTTSQNLPILSSFRQALGGGFSSTLRFLFRTRQGWILVGGTGFVIFVTFWLFRRRDPHSRYTSQYQGPGGRSTGTSQAGGSSTTSTQAQEDDGVEGLIASIVSRDNSTRKSALTDLYYLTNQKKKYKRLQQLGVPEALVKNLHDVMIRSSSTDLSDQEDLQLLLKILNNLSASSDRPIRDSLAAGIGDLILIIKSGNVASSSSSSSSNITDLTKINNGILEFSLRTLMNLAVDPENEDRIRDQNGIPPVIALLKDPHTDPSVLLQTARLLINLVFNDQNKAVIVAEGGIERVNELLEEYHMTLKGLNSSDPNTAKIEELVTKLARLIGLLSQTPDLTAELYDTITNASTARTFIDLLDRKQSSEKESGFLLSALVMILKKAKLDPNRYGAVLTRDRGQNFIDTLAKGLPDLLIVYMKSNQKNVHTNAEALLKILCELKGDITEDVMRKLTVAGLPSIAI